MDIALGNANIVLPDGTVRGSVKISDGNIAAVDEGMVASAIDLEGDYLLPGLIDVHTDNLEHHFQPRPGVRWPSAPAAVMAHDWQMLGAGVTTVLDSLSLGDYDSGGARRAMLKAAIDGVSAAKAAGMLKAEHYLHFRCELSDPALLENRREPHRQSGAAAAQHDGSYAGPAAVARPRPLSQFPPQEECAGLERRRMGDLYR